MILGMDLFTFCHVLISLIGIGAGFIVLFQMVRGARPPAWTAAFLAFTVLTSLTGFFFRRDHIMPGHILGAISLVDLTIALYALYGRNLANAWRGAYVVTAVLAQYFNVFVLINQAFQKIGPLHALAPTGAGPVFAAVQIIAILLFGAVGWGAWRRFHPGIFR